MSLQQLLNPIEVMLMNNDCEYVELPKPAFADLNRNVLHGVIRSNINRSMERIRATNLNIGLEPN